MALPGAFLRFLGVAEVLGALGLILPGLLRIRPGLTPLAAAGLVLIMIGAAVITLATMGAGAGADPAGGGAPRGVGRLRPLAAGAARRAGVPAGPLGAELPPPQGPPRRRRAVIRADLFPSVRSRHAVGSLGVMTVRERLRAAALRSITIH